MKLLVAIDQVSLIPENGDTWKDRLLGPRDFRCRIFSSLGAMQTVARGLNWTNSPVSRIEYKDEQGDITPNARAAIYNYVSTHNMAKGSLRLPETTVNENLLRLQALPS
jgi:hypothetical protein